MPIANRPYIGTWEMSNTTLVRHVPDAVVLINGHQELSTCPTCNQPLNFQKYVTTLSADGTTDSIASANLTLAIPRTEQSLFRTDGNYILQAGLEVVIFMRGYFPMTGFAGKGQDLGAEDGYDADEVPVYPYYQVFRGVTTNVTHDFNGGFYTATVQCSNLLSFWSNLKISTQGAVVGPRPDKSGVAPSVIGHTLTGMNPYSIIYDMVKVGFGAAYGVDFAMSQSTGVDAVSSDGRTSLYHHAAQWWQKRWAEHSGNLRMYGIDGSILSAFEQAWFGSWSDTDGSKKGKEGEALYDTAKTVFDALGRSNDFNSNLYAEMKKKARALGYDPLATNAAVYATGKGGTGSSYVTENVLKMQAFCLDIGKIGQINMFQTEYLSKMEIVDQVKLFTGFEFYQDVDGDFVFKPPLYNMDTRDDPVYRIEDRDLITISETESEPEATVCKGTASQFSNLGGTGLDGWLGVAGMFVDYRLVAKYGYREETFESNYMNSKQALFVSAINRLDLANAGVRSASITIPLRPELRPGYPVYVVHLDCFYYVKSFSHSFSFGGQCTTSIQGIAKRTKWFPPMDVDGGQGFPTMNQVRLDAPGEFPSVPLIGYEHYMAGETSGSGPPRTYGFPNVVMALDPNKVAMSSIPAANPTAEQYVQMALQAGILQNGPDNTYKLQLGNSPDDYMIVDVATLSQEWASVSEALAAGTYEPDSDSIVGLLVGQVLQKQGGRLDVPDHAELTSHLVLQNSLKGTFAPGSTVTGEYRYYSCSHPDPQHQGPGNIYVEQNSHSFEVREPGAPDEQYTRNIRALRDVGGGKGVGRDTSPRAVQRGIKVAAYSQKDDPGANNFPTQVVSTADIRFVTFGPHYVTTDMKVHTSGSGVSRGTNFKLDKKSTTSVFQALLMARSIQDPSELVSLRFEGEYERLYSAINTYSASLGVDSEAKVTGVQNRVSDVVDALEGSPFPPNTPVLPATSSAEGKGDLECMSALARYLAGSLWAYLNAVQSAAVKSIRAAGGDYTEANQAQAAFIRDYTDGAANPEVGVAGKIIIQNPVPLEQQTVSAIFPVSDSGGYEVYGNLPYGRGLNIERAAQALQSSVEGVDTISPAEAAQGSVSWLGGVGTNASDLEALEKFLVLWLATDDPEGSLALLEDAEQSAILALNNGPLTAESMEVLYDKATSANAKIRNVPVTSFFRGQSLSETMAASELTRLSVTGDVCSCGGYEADIYLQAYSEEFVDMYGNAPLQDYLELQVAQKIEGWQQTKDVLAGSVSDTRNQTLFEELKRQTDAVRAIGNIASARITDAAQQPLPSQVVSVDLAALNPEPDDG